MDSNPQMKGSRRTFSLNSQTMSQQPASVEVLNRESNIKKSKEEEKEYDEPQFYEEVVIRVMKKKPMKQTRHVKGDIKSTSPKMIVTDYSHPSSLNSK